MPRVSVLTAVHDGEEFVGEALGSVLAQTFTDLEHVVVDDASTDGAPDVIRRHARADARVVVLTSPVPLLPNGALARALAVARGEYVAILDADDRAMPERLERQVAYLDAHPDVGAVGAQAALIGAKGQALGAIDFPVVPGVLRWEHLFRSPLLHSAATMRRSLLEEVGGYSRHHRYATDYELFTRLARVARLANLPERLVEYRSSPGQASALFHRPQMGEVLLLVHATLAERLGLRLGLDDVSRVYRAVRGGRMDDEAAFLRTADLVGALHARFQEVEPLDDEERQLVRQRCAWSLGLMAFVHHRGYRAASQRVLGRATGLDPGLWHRGGSLAKLRRLRGRCTAPSAPRGVASLARA